MIAAHAEPLPPPPDPAPAPPLDPPHPRPTEPESRGSLRDLLDRLKSDADRDPTWAEHVQRRKVAALQATHSRCDADATAILAEVEKAATFLDAMRERLDDARTILDTVSGHVREAQVRISLPSPQARLAAAETEYVCSLLRYARALLASLPVQP